jgi:mono/diheme cytochrome c family protein
MATMDRGRGLLRGNRAVFTVRVAMASLALVLVACSKGSGGGEEATSTAAPAPAAGQATAINVPDVHYSVAQPDLDRGKELFAQKGCNACHKIGGGKLVGPDLKGVTARRDKQWIAKMILRPDVMVKEDPTAKDLFKTYMVAMPNQGVAENDLPPLMSYLKANE